MNEFDFVQCTFLAYCSVYVKVPKEMKESKRCERINLKVCFYFPHYYYCYNYFDFVPLILEAPRVKRRK